MGIEIPEETAYYVRGAIDRGLRSVEKDIRKMSEMLLDPKYAEYSEEFGLAGMIAYQDQWLREASIAIAKLPAELRPAQINAD